MILKGRSGLMDEALNNYKQYDIESHFYGYKTAACMHEPEVYT